MQRPQVSSLGTVLAIPELEPHGKWGGKFFFGDNASLWEVRADHEQGLKAGAQEVVLGCVA